LIVGFVIVHGQQPDGTRFFVEFNLEFLAWFQTEPARVGMADQQIAVAVHPGAKFSLPAAGATPASA